MKKYIHLILFVPFTNNVAGQVMPSPDATNVVERSSVPVDLFSGSSTIQVPLYGIQHDNGAEIPISLSHKTRPFKVAEIAGNVGIGWELTAGGAITRVVMDQPDDGRVKGRINFETNDGHSKLWDKYITKDSESTDYAHDVFYYTYPGGSGKFILKEKWPPSGQRGAFWYEAVQLPLSDIKIDIALSRSREVETFTLTDLYGNKYLFGQTKERTMVYRSVNGEPEEEKMKFTSTWKLNSILYADQPEEKAVVFTYSLNPIETESPSASAVFRTNVNPHDYYLANKQTTQTRTVINAYKLDKINFPKGNVQFSYGPRADLSSGVCLNSMTVYDHLGHERHKADLNYFYSNASNSTYKTFGDCGEQCKRLMLKSVSINGFKFREFEYLNELDADYELPPRNSLLIDADGNYFPDRPDELLPIAMDASEKFLGFTIPQGQSPLAKSNMLKKVYYPTGGHTEIFYSYELNLGNATIEEVRNIDESGNMISGQSYLYRNGQSGLSYTDDSYRIFFEDAFMVNSHAVSDITDLVPSGFSTVEVTDLLTHQKVKNEFHNWVPEEGTFTTMNEESTGEPGAGPYQVVFWNGVRHTGIINGPRKFIMQINDDGSIEEANETKVYPRLSEPPGASRPLIDYRIGLPSVVTHYDSSGSMVSKSEYVYAHGDNEELLLNRVIQRPVLDGAPYSHPSKWYKLYVAEYAISCNYLLLDHTVTSHYEENNIEISRERTNYTYHPDFPSLVKETHTFSELTSQEGFNTKSKTFYPSDYDEIDHFAGQEYGFSSAVLDGMVRDHMVGVPVATQREVNLPGYPSDDYRVIDINFTVFKNFSGKIYSHKLCTYHFPEPLTEGADGYDQVIYQAPELISTFSYDAAGLLSTKVRKDSIATHYAYDPQGYLISQATDPGTSSVQQTTTYTHEPLVGINTLTDATEETITYKYDSRNRLHLVRDQDEDVVERYRYDYGQEDNGLHAEIKISGDRVLGRTLTFRAINPRGYGAQMTEYQWDFEGVSKSGPSVTHSFSSAGRKTILLNILNPEYDAPLQVTSSIDICDPPEYALRGPESGCTFDDGTEPPHGVEYAFSLSNSGAPYTATVTWQYRQPDAAWHTFDRITSDEAALLSNRNFLEEGTYQIKAIISGCNGKTLTKSLEITHCSGGNNDSGGNDDESNADGEEETCTTPVSISPSSWKVEPSGDSKDFVVSSSSFRVSDNQPWISTGVSGTTLTVEVDAHPGGALRTGKVTIKKGYCTASIFISQEGPSETCADGCHWDPVDGRCEDQNGDPEKCTF